MTEENGQAQVEEEERDVAPESLGTATCPERSGWVVVWGTMIATVWRQAMMAAAKPARGSARPVCARPPSGVIRLRVWTLGFTFYGARGRTVA